MVCHPLYAVNVSLEKNTKKEIINRWNIYSSLAVSRGSPFWLISSWLISSTLVGSFIPFDLISANSSSMNTPGSLAFVVCVPMAVDGSPRHSPLVVVYIPQEGLPFMPMTMYLAPLPVSSWSRVSVGSRMCLQCAL